MPSVRLVVFIYHTEYLKGVKSSQSDKFACSFDYSLYFFPGFVLYIFFSFLLIYGDLGVGVLGLGSWIGFVGLGFSVNGLLGLLCEAMLTGKEENIMNNLQYQSQSDFFIFRY